MSRRLDATPAEHEAGFVDTFIVAASQERWRTLLASKRRRTLLQRLGGPGDFDTKCLNALEAKDQTYDSLLALLRRRGAPADCYVLSSDPGRDAQLCPLTDALKRVLGSGTGTVISCVPGRLAYFETEIMRERFLLLR